MIGQYAIPEFEYLANNIWIFTEKVDGINIRIGVDDNRLVIKGKTANSQIPTFLLDTLNQIFIPDDLISIIGGEDFCLYGEGYGVKIQKGGGNYKSDGTSFVLFDVRIGDWWLRRESVNEIADKLKIKSVPIIGQGTLIDMVHIVKDGVTSTWGDF